MDKQYAIQRVMCRVVPGGIDGNEKGTDYREAANGFLHVKNGAFQTILQKNCS
jgi:hypothetical protein